MRTDGRTLRTLLAALIAVGALAAIGCGDDDEPDQEGESAAAGNPSDRAFVADMVPHHELAVDMARLARSRGQSAFVRTLADDIIASQTEQIRTLREEDAGLRRTGVAVGSLGVPEQLMGMDHDAASLRSANPFDRAFLTQMIPHHQGALVMSRAELAKGADPQLRALAQDIIGAQRREIAAMREHLGADGSAPGGVPDGGHGAGHG